MGCKIAYRSTLELKDYCIKGLTDVSMEHPYFILHPAMQAFVFLWDIGSLAYPMLLGPIGLILQSNLHLDSAHNISLCCYTIKLRYSRKIRPHSMEPSEN